MTERQYPLTHLRSIISLHILIHMHFERSSHVDLKKYKPSTLKVKEQTALCPLRSVASYTIECSPLSKRVPFVCPEVKTTLRIHKWI